MYEHSYASSTMSWHSGAETKTCPDKFSISDGAIKTYKSHQILAIGMLPQENLEIFPL